MASLSLTISRVNHIAIHLDQIVSRRPLFYGVLFPTASAVASDLLVQLTSNRIAHRHDRRYYYGSSGRFGEFGPSRKRNTNYLNNLLQLDMNRLGVFATFGFCTLGLWHYALYAKILDRAVARVVNPDNIRLTRSVKLVFEGCVHTPLVYFPCFYFIKDRFIDHECHSPITYRLPSADDLKTSYSFWLPAQFVTFSLPAYWRMPWMSVASFFWTSVLSFRCNA